jgi:iron complex outermembrane receptor protein
MLDYVTFTQRDFSEQTLVDFVGNITGDLAQLPNSAMIAFAAGVEYREHEGSFRPDPIAASGETAGIPSAPTAGGFDVTEIYAEFNFPVLFDAKGADYLEFNLAGRYSDYSTFGGEDTYKLGALWQPTGKVSVRGSFSTGIRAPGIGELFGGAAREDFTFLDPCADVLALNGSANGGRDTPQSPQIIANCRALGIPVDLAQRNPQLSAVSAGNESLIPETSENLSLGAVYSSGPWTGSIDFYDLDIEDAVQGQDPGDVITACVNTLDPFFCDAVQRTNTGLINLVDNQLQNIGAIESSGFDFAFGWTKNYTFGTLDFGLDATYLDEYLEFTQNPDGSLTENDRTGTITNETFQRAFPEWKARWTFDWSKDKWFAGTTFRYTDSLEQPSGNELSSRIFIDVLANYKFNVGGEDLTASIGINNILDENPATCDSCGVIGMSPVVHDLPGTVAFVRLVYDVK